MPRPSNPRQGRSVILKMHWRRRGLYFTQEGCPDENAAPAFRPERRVLLLFGTLMLYFNFLRFRFFRLGNGELQYTVFECGIDLIGFDTVRDTEAAAE